MRLSSTRLAIIALVSCCVYSLALAYPTGPPNRVTGAPGEDDCTLCHNTWPLNSGGGAANIAVNPEWGPWPDDTVEIQIAVEQPGQLRWGFEITAIDYSGEATPFDFIITDSARTQISHDGNGRTYIKHTREGTDSGTVDVAPGWSFKWAVPRFLSLMVDFHVAANAANGDNLPTGDYIYTDSLQLALFIDYFFNTGDVNEDGLITSADIIYMVAFVFKGGFAPLPCEAVGDVNCSGTVTSADIIYLVGYVFKGGPAPCDVMTLFPDTWWCP